MNKPHLIIEKLIGDEWEEQRKINLLRIVINNNWFWKSYTVGRSPDCTITITCQSKLISRFQCTFERDENADDHSVMDGSPDTGKSSNGTNINGAKMFNGVHIRLKHRDIISISPFIRLIYYNEKMSILRNADDDTCTGTS